MRLIFGPPHQIAREVLAHETAAARCLRGRELNDAERGVALALRKPYRAREVERCVRLDAVRDELGMSGIRIGTRERNRGKTFSAGEKISIVAHGGMLPRQRKQLDVVAAEHDAMVRRT